MSVGVVKAVHSAWPATSSRCNLIRYLPSWNPMESENFISDVLCTTWLMFEPASAFARRENTLPLAHYLNADPSGLDRYYKVHEGDLIVQISDKQSFPETLILRSVISGGFFSASRLET